MIYPKFIKENNTIGVPAPSAGASNELKQNKIKNSKKMFESFKYKIKLSDNIFNSYRGRSADKKIRAQELNDMINDRNIDMIICASGGEFLVEILPYVNFKLIKENPKFVCGFSDPTGLLYTITTKYDVSTIYGQNFSSMGSEPLNSNQKNFMEIIKGNIIEQNNSKYYENEPLEKITGLEPDNLTEKVYWNTLDGKEVTLKGRIIGGCFDIISELAGTKYDGIKKFNEKYKNDGIIWYFDNCEITMEETIRTLWKLNELEFFKYTKGIIFGRFGVNTTYFDYDVKTCLEDSILPSLNIPIIYDADFSHKAPCLTVINGSIATVNVKNGKGKISFKLI